MEDMISVTTADGNEYKIKVIETFQIEAYPKKAYIAYTFGELSAENMVRSYISIINENEDTFTLEAITDKEEWQIVQNTLKSILENKAETSGDINYES